MENKELQSSDIGALKILGWIAFVWSRPIPAVIMGVPHEYALIYMIVSITLGIICYKGFPGTLHGAHKKLTWYWWIVRFLAPIAGLVSVSLFCHRREVLGEASNLSEPVASTDLSSNDVDESVTKTNEIVDVPVNLD